MTCFRTTFHMPNSNAALFITIRWKANNNFAGPLRYLTFLKKKKYVYGNKVCTYLQGPLLYSIRAQDLNVSGASVAPTSEFRASTILLLPNAGN